MKKLKVSFYNGENNTKEHIMLNIVLYKDWCRKKETKHSSVLLLSLFSFLLHQSLVGWHIWLSWCSMTNRSYNVRFCSHDQANSKPRQAQSERMHIKKYVVKNEWDLYCVMIINITTGIFKHFGVPIFMESFVWKWPGLNDFFWFFEMDELGASEAHKAEILNYEVLKI